MAKDIGLLLAMAGSVVLALPAAAQVWPARPVTLVVGTPPGGGFERNG
jgi:tripartite-type tricarboxylate transporter receptor subunit TctC